VAARRVVTVELEAKTTGILAGFATTAAAAKGLNKELETLAVKHTASFNKLTNAGLGLGVALVGGFLLAEKAAYSFDKQMSAVGAVAQATVPQLAALREAALKAGQDTAFTATQAAQAEEELAKAGVSTADILSGGLTGALSLAAAGTLDLATAAGIAAQAINEFELHGKDMAHVADLLTAGANKSATDVQGLGASLKQVGTVAHMAGWSLDQTVATLALFAQHGLQAEDGGTALKTMLLKLENPSQIAAREMKALGINVYDAQGHFVSASALAGQLQTALSGVDEKTRNMALGLIFGTRAVRGATVMFQAGASGIQDWTNKVEDAGIAQRTADEKLNNLAGDVKKLEGSLSKLAITASGGASTGLRFLAQGAQSTVNWFSQLPTPLQSTISMISGISGVSLLAAVGFVKVRGAGANFLSTLSDMGPRGERAAGALGKIGSSLGKWGLYGIAAFAAYEGVSALFNELNKKTPIAKHDVDALTVSLQAFGETGKATGEMAKVFGVNLSGLSGDFKLALTYMTQASALQAKMAAQPLSRGGPGPGYRDAGNALEKLKEQAAQAKNNLTELDTAFANVASQGGVAQAQIAFAQLAKAQGWTDAQTQQALALMPKYQQALAAAAVANTGLAKGLGDVSANQALFNAGMEDAISKGRTYVDVLHQLHGAAEDLDGSMLSANNALKNVTDTLKKNHNALKGNTTAALEDRIAVADMAKAAADVADKMYAQTGSIDAANGAYNNYIGQLRKTLLQAGLTKSQVDELLKSFAKMPPVKATQILTPGLSGALTGIRILRTEIDKLHGKTVNVQVHYGNTGGPGGSTASAQRWGGLYQHADVGVLREAGTYPAVTRGARYAFAEPQTKGEAFIPKSGNYGRSMAILSAAAGWYGASVVPGRRGGGAEYTHRIIIEGTGVIAGLRREIYIGANGNVQTYLGKGR
jgi:TP901 family phage tail tape measure protein